jgi:hypothetical protein
MKKTLLRTVCALSIALGSMSAYADDVGALPEDEASEAAEANYQGVWYNAELDGQAFNIGQSGNLIAFAWYFYDDAGKATYLTLGGELVDGVVTSELIRTSYEGEATEAYDKDKVVRESVGDATITFDSVSGKATFEYTYDTDKTGTIELTPFFSQEAPVTDE